MARLAAQVIAGMGRSRDMLPLPLPYAGVASGTTWHPSRSVRRRMRAKQGWQSWANDAVAALTWLAGLPTPDAAPASPLHAAASIVR